MGKRIMRYVCCIVAAAVFLAGCIVAEVVKYEYVLRTDTLNDRRQAVVVNTDEMSLTEGAYNNICQSVFANPDDTGLVADTAPIYEDEAYICYEDRIIRRQGCDIQNAGTMSDIIAGLCELCPSIENAYVIPIPHRIVVEAGYEEAKASYEQYMTALAEQLPEKAYLVDTMKALQEHSEEYIFFSTEDAWTARGAYYGMQELCKMMQRDCIPLNEYGEYVYNTFLGSLALEEEIKAYISSDMKYDSLYYYLLPGTVDDAEVFDIDSIGKKVSYKKPLITNSDTNLGAFIDGGYTRAIVEGESYDKESPDEKILLICDGRGKLLAPYLKDYYDGVYVVNIREDYEFIDDIQEIVEEHNISEMVIAQTVIEMGAKGYYRALSKVLER